MLKNFNASSMRKVLIGLGVMTAIYEIVALEDAIPGDTISVNDREFFHTNSPVGRAAWLVAWGTFSAWFAQHIDRPIILKPNN